MCGLVAKVALLDVQVPREDRTATMGLVNIVKSIGASVGPLVTGYLIQRKMWTATFVLAGSAKLVYDLLLLISFLHVKPDAEKH